MSENAVLEMPRDYVDMDASELEYDGGFNWGKAIGLTIAIAGGITLLAGIPT